MNWSAILFCVAVVLTVGEAGKPLPGRCTPNQIFNHKGLICKCPASGRKDEAICEYENNTPKPGKLEMENWAGSIYCQPGKEFTMDGQTCCCPLNALKADAYCGAELENTSDCREVGSHKCVPGSLFMDSASRLCICGSSGKVEDAVCAPYVPPPKPSLSRGNEPDARECVPGQELLFDDLMCKCKPSGILIIPEDCTYVKEDAFFPQEMCEPGEIYWNGFRYCICPESGYRDDSNCFFLVSKRSSTAASTRRGILPAVAGCLLG